MFKLILERIDLFGMAATMNFDGKLKSKSKFGGVCSILFYSFVMWATINGSEDLYKKTNPKTINSESYNDNPRSVSISPDGFPIAFQVLTPSNMNLETYIDESILTIKVFHYLIEKVQHSNGTIERVWTINQLQTERCTPEHFGKQLGPSYSLIFADPITCIAKEQPALENIQVQGVVDSAIFQRIYVEVAPCNNITSGGKCSSPEKIRSYISGGSFATLYNNMVVNPNNYERPDAPFQDYHVAMLSFSNFQEITIELGQVEVSTDYGWLLNDVQSTQFTKVAKIRQNQLNEADNDGTLIDLYLEMGKLETFYLRKYKKIQDIIAEVSGLTSTALLILLITTTPYLRYKLRETLMNDLFELNLSSKLRRFKSMHPNQYNFDQQDTEIVYKNSNQKPLESPEDRKIHSSPDLSNDASMKLEAHKTPKNGSFTLSINPIESSSKPIKTKKQEYQNLVRLKHTPSQYSPKAPEKSHSTTLHDSPHDFQRGVTTENDKSPLISVFHIKEAPFEEKDNKTCRFVGEKSVKLNAKVLDENDVEKPDISFNCDTYEKVEGHEDPLQTGRKYINKQNIKRKLTIDKGKPVDLSVWEYISSLGCYSKVAQEKVEAINEGVKEINKRLDVRYILKKLAEVEKLKALLLDDDQLMLFNNLPKPQIGKSNRAVRNTVVSQTLLKQLIIKPEKVSEDDVIEAYSRVISKSCKSIIDQKLLEVFDQKIF